MFHRIVKRKHPICVNDAFREVSPEHQGSTHGAMPEHERNLPSLFLGKRQELRGALARCIAVERYNVRVKRSGESGKQQQRVLGRLAKCFSLFDQQTYPLHGGLGLQRGLPFDMLEWV